MKKECKVIVHGRVQFVMYRDFAQRTARKLHIVGTVRNLPDTTVEIVAQGEAASLDAYLERLRKGPVLANVERIDVSWQSPSMTTTQFEILY